MTSQRFEGKTAVVTGAASGIGRAITRRLTTEGGRVIAGAATFLASDDATYITGVNLFVDGGWEHTAYPDLRRVMASGAGAADPGA